MQRLSFLLDYPSIKQERRWNYKAQTKTRAINGSQLIYGRNTESKVAYAPSRMSLGKL